MELREALGAMMTLVRLKYGNLDPDVNELLADAERSLLQPVPPEGEGVWVPREATEAMASAGVREWNRLRADDEDLAGLQRYISAAPVSAPEVMKGEDHGA